MNMAKNELLYCNQLNNNYEYVLINNDVGKTTKKIQSIIESFRIRRQNRHDINSFIKKITNNNA